MNLQGTYTDIVEIGSGGGGTVFRAYHVRMQKYVVLKKIHDSIQNNVDIRGELNILKNLRHSYLPTVLDFFEDNGSIYTVMDYIPGESFESLLGRGVRFSQAQVAKYAAQLGEVLSYLHGQKPPIIHGDIKPANIMLTPEDNICLIDFNISQLQNGILNQNMGYTPGYASPEQVSIVQAMQDYYASCYAANQMYPGNNMQAGGARNGTVILDSQGSNAQAGGVQNGTVILNPQENSVPVLKQKMDERSDLYSVGATLYALLSGVIPDGDFSRIIPIEDLVENCSEGLAHLIHKCMEFQPAKRFSTTAEYVKAVSTLAKVDKRYKRLVHRQEFTVIFCILGMAACIILAIFGKERMGAERISAYNNLLAQMEELQGDSSAAALEEMEQLYKEATGEFPLLPGAYYQKALYLYNNRAYTEMIEFISGEVLSNAREFSDEETGGFYFLLANGYLETDDLSNAIGYYKTAVKYDPYDSTYYSDYAIALARSGDLEEAEKVLEEAVNMGLANDKVLLAEGEIKGRQGLLEEASVCFEKCISETEDEYVKFRAYIMWAKLYDTEEPTENLLQQKQEILTKAQQEVAEGYKAAVLEQLAQTSIDLGDETGSDSAYLQAVDCLNKIAELGWDTYVTHNNIGILYEKVGQYADAQQEFLNMLTEYGEDYRTYKRLAFLEIDIQAAKENKNRNYEQFLAYYQKAVSLFEDSDARADSDMEIQLLNQAYTQLQEGNWF